MSPANFSGVHLRLLSLLPLLNRIVFLLCDKTLIQKENRADGWGMDVFVARQPIFDRKCQVSAYELLFRSNGVLNEFDGTDAASATMQVMASSLLSIGWDNMVAGKNAFLNFDRTLLVGGFHSLLPRERLVIEILESVEPDEQVLEACQSLQAQGYKIALDDFVYDSRLDPLTEMANLIKVDLQTTSRPEQERLVKTYKPRGIELVAEKVETEEEFKWASRAGYDLFQGYFFARPTVVRGSQIPAAKISCLRLLSEMQKVDLDFPLLEDMVSKDVALCYKLMRYVNSGLFYRRSEIRSVNHALVVLGEEGIRHWIALATLPVMAKDKPGELVTHSLVRARFCELLGQLAGIPLPAQAFLMGLFSLLDAFLDLPLEEALAQVSLDADIRGTLLGTASEREALPKIYRLACRYEEGDWEVVRAKATELSIGMQPVGKAYSEAALWAQQALHATGRRSNTRRHVRHDISGALRIRWEDDKGGERVSNAKLVNVSTGGLQLQVDEKIPLRANVFCNEPKLGISGRGSVRYCNPSKGKYMIGLEFGNGTGWREPSGAPQPK